MTWSVRSLLIVCLAGYLTGCSSINLSDVATGAGATAGAALGALTGNPADCRCNHERRSCRGCGSCRGRTVGR